MEARLLKYTYRYYVQGTMEEGEDYALVYVPEDASFGIARSVLMNKMDRAFYEIILESVKDMTVRF